MAHDTMKLPRFRGHPMIGGRGVHDAAGLKLAGQSGFRPAGPGCGSAWFPIDRIAEIWEHLGDLPLIFHPLSRGPRVLEQRLRSRLPGPSEGRRLAARLRAPQVT
jgi:hypothetical protein